MLGDCEVSGSLNTLSQHGWVLCLGRCGSTMHFVSCLELSYCAVDFALLKTREGPRDQEAPPLIPGAPGSHHWNPRERQWEPEGPHPEHAVTHPSAFSHTKIPKNLNNPIFIDRTGRGALTRDIRPAVPAPHRRRRAHRPASIFHFRTLSECSPSFSAQVLSHLIRKD